MFGLIKTFVRCAMVCIIFGVASIIGYLGSFCVILRDDIEIYSGKSTVKKAWGKQKNLLRKYLFLDFKHFIPTKHYVLMWVYVCSSILTIIGVPFYDLFYGTKYSEIPRVVCLISFHSAMLSAALIIRVRYGLYRGNKIRKRPKKQGKHKK